ncbi:MAG TPA: bifunctional phosphopantothenoylcysteine decarboxylase/phosphopantothenate--cysteine ligase CoaBC [Gemmatimonadales bacterium]|nr:bifunctional phosphopantothenoylcysteine decarboxylase/phosphopantothenate--cysteine ligase CoaBC [Gemmatimonadales bacterium]
MLAGRRVLLGLSGGIASYKSCYLARALTERGALVTTVMTRGAAEFVGPATFEALTHQPVLRSVWEPGHALDHVRLAQESDLIVVAPATAHVIARAAQGLADDLLTTILVAATVPILMAPAMNDAMFAHPATQANLATLESRGVRFVGPDAGALAEGPSSLPGRMSEPDVILAHVLRLLAGSGPLSGRRVVVTAGPTREAIDPIRFLSNRSSGRMGHRLAEVAWERGADVTLITGPTALPAPVGARVVRIETTRELEDAVRRELPQADVLIMAAAPSDYRPSSASETKRPRSTGDWSLPLEPTADILSATRAVRKAGSIIVGFALETGDALAKGRTKLEQKGLDLIVINDALEPGAGFDVDTNRVTIVSKTQDEWDLPLQSKRDVAVGILERVERYLVP